MKNTVYVLNVYEYENTQPCVYNCQFVPGELKEVLKKAFQKLLLDFDEEDIEDAFEYLQEEGEYRYRGGDAYIFKVESI